MMNCLLMATLLMLLHYLSSLDSPTCYASEVLFKAHFTFALSQCGDSMSLESLVL